MFVSGGGGTSFDHDPGFNQFSLGGPLRLGSFNNDELRGDNYLLGVVGLLHEWARLPDVLGGERVSGRMAGRKASAFNAWRDSAQYKVSLSALRSAMEMFFGPVFMGYSQSLTDGWGCFYVLLGPVFRALRVGS